MTGTNYVLTCIQIEVRDHPYHEELGTEGAIAYLKQQSRKTHHGMPDPREEEFQQMLERVKRRKIAWERELLKDLQSKL